MRVYLDNNVLIDYEKAPEILPQGTDIEYRCSYVHIEELMESTRDVEERRKKRFETIHHLTHNIFMVNSDIYGVQQELNSCERYYDVLLSSESRALYLSMANASNNWLKGKDPDMLINYFGIDKKRINNYTVEELLNKHRDFIEYYVQSTDDGNRMASFLSFFNILDLLGFWRDKITDGVLMNRMFDAQHSYFATGCNFFVSNDRRTCMKSNILYQYYGYKTKAISLQKFLQMIGKKCKKE